MYASPLRDGGYDIADYNAIHPDYGTVEDFRAFVEAAHQRGMRVIADLVMNHTSSEHPWFQEARSSRDSPKRDWYVWADHDERWSEARIIFLDTESSNWTWDSVAEQYYWHRFFGHQPDLNYDNPEVQEAMLDALRFWLDLGIDGFRLDAVPYLYERDGTNGENLAETHEFLKQVRATVDAEYPDRVLLAEANQWPADVVEYFGDGDECHMAFHFPVMPRMFMALRREEALPIIEILDQTPEIPDNAQWGLFLRNHDELTLEMVTDEERDYMYAEYAKDPRMRLNLGIRRRLAPLLDNGRDEIELMTAILFSLPGSPVLYYGDEIGMGDNIYLGDRDGVRTPMQWTGDRNGGFSRADFAQLYLPPLMDPVWGFQATNVEAQLRTPTSLLRWLHRFIGLRKAHPVFGLGTLRGAAAREHEDLRPHPPLGGRHRPRRPQRRALGAGRRARPVTVRRPCPGGDVRALALPGDRGAALPAHARTEGVLLVPAEATGVGMSRVAGARRGPPRGGPDAVHARAALVRLEVPRGRARHRRRLDGRSRGRAGAGARTRGGPLPPGDARALPRARRGAVGRRAAGARAGSPRSTASSSTTPPSIRSSPPSSRRSCASSGRWRLPRARRSSSARSPTVEGELEHPEQIRPMGVEQSNTSLVFDDELVLKLYRRLEPGVNPELELLRFLTERGFPNIPSLEGWAQYLGKPMDATLATLQHFVAERGRRLEAGARLARGRPRGVPRPTAPARRGHRGDAHGPRLGLERPVVLRRGAERGGSCAARRDRRRGDRAGLRVDFRTTRRSNRSPGAGRRCASVCASARTSVRPGA